MKENLYIFTFEDKQGNELESLFRFDSNIKEAKKYASKLQAESKLNDLFRIKVKRA
jgi:hypothetical protein